MQTDADLVQAGAGGSRQAFGEIVERYQALVCAVAYAGTGDVALAEDIAQETFLAAWKGMPGLREPAKLKAWLAGIARNLARSAQRQRRESAPLDLAAGTPSAGPSPLDQVLEHEEVAVVWSALEQIPETYREPLVLFYREGGSVETVAEALEMTPDAVKQRLSRGRQMLKQQVASRVESALARTRPGRAFTIAVLAALPAAAPQVAAAGVAARAAEGSTVAGAASTALAGAVWGPLLGVLGGYVGARASLAATRSERERAFVKRSIRVFVAYALAFAALEAIGLVAFRRVFATVAAQIAIVGLYTAGLVALILRGNRRQRQIQIEEGTFVDPARIPPADLSTMPPSAVYGSFAGSVFGGTLWMMIMAAVARDWAMGALILAVAVLVFVVCTRVVLRRPERYFAASRISLMVIALLTFAALNLRWDAWMVAYRSHWTYEPLADLPLWAMNALVAMVYGALFAGEYRRKI